MLRQSQGREALYMLRSEPIGYKDYAMALFDAASDVYVGQCPMCGYASKYRNPLRLRMFGTRCSDFATAVGPLLCSKQVSRELEGAFPEVGFLGVEFLPRKPRGKKQLECGEFVCLWPRDEVDAFLPESSVRLEEQCKACYGVKKKLELPEKIVTQDDGTGEMVYRVEQTKANGLILRANDLGASRVFRALDTRIVAREPFVRFIRQRRYTNIVALRAGWIVG